MYNNSPKLQNVIGALANHGSHTETIVLDRDSAQLLSKLMGAVDELRARLERRGMVDATHVAADLFKVMDKIDNHRV